jgi:hypothetical protein
VLTVLAMIALATIEGGCPQAGPTVFERSAETRQLTAALQTHFAQAVDAANRAVMAHTDEASHQFARDAERARDQVKCTQSELVPLLRELGYAEEVKLLEEFRGKFAAYEVLDRKVLELAVENTNTKATQLAFGPAREAADAFEQALGEVAKPAGADGWRLRALTLEAVAAVREIQLLQAPHVAEASDAVMTQMEEKSASSEAAARRAVAELATLVAPAQLEPANAALDRFNALHARLVALSRRNTNVRSLELTLGEKHTIIETCEASLGALSDSLRKRVSRPER